MIAAERFELMRPLGRGGYGTVFEAFDRERGEHVAVKPLHQTSPRALASFKREFRTLSTLLHPGLPKLHDLFALGDDWCFSMELVDGEDLSAWRRSTGRSEATRTDALGEERSAIAAAAVRIDEAATRRVRAVLEQLLTVLELVHASGFVHCDVKPSNVRVRPDGRTILLDFGLARALCEDAGSFAGTLAYAAPEQLRGVVSPACDLYALGSLVFELLAGSPPFGSGREAAENKQRRDAPSLVTRLPAGDKDLAELVARLLSRVPGERLTAVESLVRPAARRNVARGTAFVGRADVLATIDRALDELHAGAHGVIVLEGASGIGKTTLLAPTARTHHGRSSRVLRAVGARRRARACPLQRPRRSRGWARRCRPAVGRAPHRSARPHVSGPSIRCPRGRGDLRGRARRRFPCDAARARTNRPPPRRSPGWRNGATAARAC